MALLDEIGLARLWEKIKAYVKDNASAVTVDSALSSTSTNPVQNKVVNEALAGKASSNHTHAYLPTAGGAMTGNIETSGGGCFAVDGNVYINSNGFADWLTNLLSNRYANSGGYFGSNTALQINGGALTYALAQLTLECSGSCFRIRNDGGATYFMNGNASAWTNYTYILTSGEWVFPTAVTINGGITSVGVYNHTTSNSANVQIAASGTMKRSSSSSKRYKYDIFTDLNNDLDPHRLYDIIVYRYKYNADYLALDDIRYLKDVIGFIAEDVYEKYPIAANYSIDEETGEVIVEDWDARYIIPAMLKLIQQQKADLDAKEERINALENRLNTLEERVNELCKS